MKKFSLILATDYRGGIGKNGGLPWHIPCDLQNFKALTVHNVVVMGRHTWNSLPVRPLPHRTNIVVSQGTIDDVLLQRTLDPHKEWFVIGGSRLYSWFLERPEFIQRIYWTQLDEDYNCDTFLSQKHIDTIQTFNRIHHPRVDAMNKKLLEQTLSGRYAEFISSCDDQRL